MTVRTPGTGKTRAYLVKANALDVADELQEAMPLWNVTVQPSPEKPGHWGVRAERVLADINENGIGGLPDGRKPLMLADITPPPLAGCTGRMQVVWLKINGITFPKED
jgi:hypothetical protein